DHSPISVRSAYGLGVEGADPHGARESSLRNDRKAPRVEPVGADGEFGWVIGCRRLFGIGGERSGRAPTGQRSAGKGGGALMPLTEADIKWVEEPKIGFAEQLYLPAIFAGLQTTVKHLFKPRLTQQFPERRPTLPANYRGVHRLNRDEDGRVKC